MKIVLLLLLFGLGAVTLPALSLRSAVTEPRRPAPAPEITLTGVVERRFAIGGETTGWTLRYDQDKRVDLLLPPDAFRWISEGLAVAAKGRFGTRKLPERGEVTVFIVTEIHQVQT